MQNPLRPGLKSLGGDTNRLDPFIIDLLLAVRDDCFCPQKSLEVRDPLKIDSRFRTRLLQSGDSLLMILSPWPFAAESDQ